MREKLRFINLGKKLSDVTKQKMRERMQKQIPWNKGKVMSIEWKSKRYRKYA